MSSDKKKRFAYSFLLPMAILLSMTVIGITVIESSIAIGNTAFYDCNSNYCKAHGR